MCHLHRIPEHSIAVKLWCAEDIGLTRLTTWKRPARPIFTALSSADAAGISKCGQWPSLIHFGQCNMSTLSLSLYFSIAISRNSAKRRDVNHAYTVILYIYLYLFISIYIYLYLLIVNSKNHQWMLFSQATQAILSAPTRTRKSQGLRSKPSHWRYHGMPYWSINCGKLVSKPTCDYCS